MKLLSGAGAWLRARMVDDAHRAWKFSSIQIAAASGLIAEIWNTLPDGMRDHLPSWIVTAAPIFMVIAIIVARISKKKDAPGG